MQNVEFKKRHFFLSSLRMIENIILIWLTRLRDSKTFMKCLVLWNIWSHEKSGDMKSLNLWSMCTSVYFYRTRLLCSVPFMYSCKVAIIKQINMLSRKCISCWLNLYRQAFMTGRYSGRVTIIKLYPNLRPGSLDFLITVFTQMIAARGKR